MPLHIIRNDITHMEVDAIVNAAHASLLGGGGVDGAIHAAAGPELLEACRALGGCRVGQAKLTEAYRLPCRYVIHTVGPRWRGGMLGERRQLASCYREALALAAEHSCETVAFPLISAGTYGYPKDKAMKVALDTIGDFLEQHDMTVFLVLFGQESTALGRKLDADIKEYIDEHYVSEHRPPSNRREREETPVPDSAAFDAALRDQRAWESAAVSFRREEEAQESVPAQAPLWDEITESLPIQAPLWDEITESLPIQLPLEDEITESVPVQSPRESASDTGHSDTGAFSWPKAAGAPQAKKPETAPRADRPATAPAPHRPRMSARPPRPMAPARPPVPHTAAKQEAIELEHLFDELDESFQQMLLRKIDESGMTDAQCYKKANIDRKLFSKIRNDVQYKPKKTTAIAFAVALELDMDETEELLRKAGYALSNSRKFDVIIAYFIEHRKYNIYEINETLFYYDQSLLGA